MTKRQIIETGISLGIDYGMTVSCYDPSETGGACRPLAMPANFD